MTIDYKALGGRIRAIRKKKNITQEELAERASVCTTHISHVETGNTIPSLAVVVHIANALEVSLDSLLCDSLVVSGSAFNDIYSEELKDCSTGELLVIAEVTAVVKKSLRKVRILDAYSGDFDRLSKR